MNNRIPVGARVSWQSQVRGKMLAKSGTVKAFIPAASRVASQYVPLGGTRKYNEESSTDRYLVEVVSEKTGRRTFYAPFARALERQSAEAGDALTVEFKNGELTSNFTKRIRTPEELLAHAGLDPLEWEVAKDGLTINSYEMNAGEGEVMPLFQIKLRLNPCTEGRALVREKANILAAVRAEASGKFAPIDLRPFVAQPYLAELCLYDVHLQSLAWGREVGEDYDVRIAEDTYRDAFESILSAAARFNPERILLPFGQDFFHTDILVDGKGGATHKGTQQDTDSRWQKAFMVGRRLITQLVLAAAKQVAPVDVLVIPGNHDTTKTWYLGEVIDSTFLDHPHVRVDNRPVRRKYYPYGQNLLGFTHGDQEQGRNLGLLMAQEAREDWGRTTFREWHMGHLHKEWTDENMGVRSRIMPALAPADAWHNHKGFVQNIRGARGFVWRKSGGIESITPYDVPPSPAHLTRIGPLLRGDAPAA